MDQRLKDRVALVTGAGRGIGQAIAGRLAREGALVWLADIDEPEARAAAEAIEGAVAARVDITDSQSVAALAQAIGDRHGRLDLLVNNAAILDMTAYDEMTIERFIAVHDVNLNGAVRVTMAMVPLMRRSQTGPSILNIASVNGLRGSRDSLAYSTAKGGVVNLTRCLASELGPDGIRVNAIAPGFILTRMSVTLDGSNEHETDWFKYIYVKHRRIPMAKGGTPEDIAGPAFFFCSDDSRYVTGQILPVDGGMMSTL
ncbi:MAG: SDR family NAD(P)-dependent oxidoreductase [Geminicoccaceae bacterium]